MKIIRWWGIVVFIVLLTVLVLAWYLLAPTLIGNAIEDFGSEALGAKVEVSEVELSLFPVSVTLNKLVAADPDRPMQNIFESEKVSFSVDSESLFWKKIVVDELTLQGVKTGTARQQSGELVGGRKTTQVVSKTVSMTLPDVAQVDVEELVGSADLITLKRIDRLKQSQSKLQQEWQQALDKGEMNKRLEAIDKEYNRLSKRLKDNKLNLINDRKDWKKLKKSIDEERRQMSQLSDKLKEDKKSLSNQLKLVKQGPEDDLNKVMDGVGLGNGVDGLVDKYLGPQYTPYVKQALELIKQVDTSQSTDEKQDQKLVQLGEKVYFKDEQVFPELLIKKINLSGSDNDWRLDGVGFDLGYLPWLTGKPAKLNMQFGGQGEAIFDFVSHWPSSTQMNTQIKSSITQWPIVDMTLIDSPEGRWSINSGTLTANVEGKLTLKAIDLVAKFSVAAPKIDVPENIADWQQSLAKSINQQQQLDFTLNASGDIYQPSISLKSNMEGLLKQAVGDKLKQKAQKLTGEVKSAIAGKVGDLSSLENFDGNFSDWQNQIADKDKLLQDLLGKIKI